MYKKQAQQRLADKYLKESENAYLRRMHALKELLKVEGWKVVLDDLEKQIEALKGAMVAISPFRIFTCLEIKSELKALTNLYARMKNVETEYQYKAQKGGKNL